ncbi:MAG: hypothetical protein LBR40_05685 [Bacilli bacterium]|jgi:hypothetical protein|nr:hypothetical protein [Bacilli bacterium]
MKKRIIAIIIIILIVFGFYAYKSDLFLSADQKQEKLKQEQIKEIKEDTLFPELKQVTFDELDAKIKSGEDFVAYFAWPENCGDSRHFELNSFDDYLKDNNIKNKIVVVDLDKLAPDALANDELRAPIAKRFLINTWTKDESFKNGMELKAPQLVHYKDGKVYDLVSWTVLNNDNKYGIKKELTDKFFANVK